MYRNIDQYLYRYREVWFTVVGPHSIYDHYLLTLWKMDRVEQEMGKVGKIISQIHKPTVKECLDELDYRIGLGDIH